MNNIERKPRYAMRKLSIGLVSCMLGFTLMAQPSRSYAAGGAEGEETEVSQLLEEEQSEDNSLEISDEKIDGPVGQEEEKNIYKYNFVWKTYEDNEKGLYDEAHNGDPVKLKLRLTYADPENPRNRKYVYSDDIDFVIGENKSIDLDIDEYAQKTGIENPTFKEAALVADKKANNYKFITGTKTPAGSKEFDYVISQNMDTKLKEEIEEGAIILDKDNDKININYKIQEYKLDGQDEDGTPKFATEPTDKTVRRKREDIPLNYEKTFKDGKEIVLAWEDGTIGGAINRNSELDLFSLLGKNRKYGIAGEFKDENHKKYYTLKIEGSDLEGWKVTLGSNLKQEDIKENKISEFKKEYIDDDTLDEGTEVVKTKGVNGVDEETYKIIYFIGEDGEKQTVDKKFVNSKKITELVNEIIRRGTKKKSNPSGPIITPGGDITPTDPKIDTPSDEDEDDWKLIQDLIDEITKETETKTPDENPTDVEKPAPEKESENESKTEKTNPKKESKKDESTPAKKKHSNQNGKKANPKTGVTGSAAVVALGLSSLFASLGLRKKND